MLNPKIGTPCVAQSIEDNSWYRGKILALDGQEAEVLFVDYGNKQKSQLSDLKAIEKTFLTLPPQAYHCCLAAPKIQEEWTMERHYYLGAIKDEVEWNQKVHYYRGGMKIQDEWTQEDKTKFEDESMSVDLTATFSQRTSDGKYRVRLTYTDDDGDYVQVLNEFYGAPSTVNAPQLRGSGGPFGLPSNTSKVTVAWFYHSCRFYLALPSTNDLQVRQLCDSFFLLLKYLIFHFMFS